MRKLLILFISIVFVSCNQQTSNVDNAEWSGSISENDNKTQIVRDVMQSYVDNNMATMKDHFNPEAKISVNDDIISFDEMVAGFASGHEKFDNITHSNVIATTMFYNNGKVFTNTWYDWSGISKNTGEEVNLRGYCSWEWDNDKIVSVYNAFDPTKYNEHF